MGNDSTGKAINFSRKCAGGRRKIFPFDFEEREREIVSDLTYFCYRDEAIQISGITSVNYS